MRFNLMVKALLLCSAAITFTVHAETFEVQHQPKGSAGPGIKISFDGAKYTPARPVSLSLPTGISMEATVARIIRAQREDTPAAYAALWETGVRGAVVQTFTSNMSHWKLLRDEMRALTAVNLKGVIRYGAMTLVWCELVSPSGVVPKIFPLKNESGKLVLSNNLSDDLVYSQLLLMLGQ